MAAGNTGLSGGAGGNAPGGVQLSSATATLNVISSASSDATTTSSDAALTFKTTVSHAANDLEYNFTDSSNVSLLSIDNEGDVVAYGDVKALSSDNGTAASGTGVTVALAGVSRSQLFKVTVSYTNFITAGVTHDVTIWTVPAKTRVVRLIADVTAPFTDGAGPITSISMVAGKTAGGNEYLTTQDVLSGAITIGEAEADLGTAVVGGISDIPSWSGTTAIQARFTADQNFGAAGVTTLTSGSVTFYLEVVRY